MLNTQQRVQAFIERLKAMNPLVNIHAASESVLHHTASTVKQYDLIIAIGLSHAHIQALNARTRAAQVPLIVAQVLGRYGYAFSDLLTHQYKRYATTAVVGHVTHLPLIRKLPDKEIEEQREIVFPSYEHVSQCKVDRQTHKLFIATQGTCRALALSH